MCLYRFFVALDSFVCLCDNSFYSCSHMYLELVSHHFSREDNGKGFYSHLVQTVWFFVFFSSLNIYLSLILHNVSKFQGQYSNMFDLIAVICVWGRIVWCKIRFLHPRIVISIKVIEYGRMLSVI